MTEQSYYNTKLENFVDVPVRSLIFLLKKLKISSFFEKYVKDVRAKKGIYSIPSLLMIALQILMFRSRSKNHFYQNKKLGRARAYKNLGVLAQIREDRFPHSKTLDDAFWILNPTELEPILFDIFKHLRSSKLFKNHPSLKKTVIIFYSLMALSLALIKKSVNIHVTHVFIV